MLSPQRLSTLRWIAVFIAVSGLGSSAGAQAEPAAADPSAAHQALISQHCVSCHNSRMKTAGLELDSMMVADIAEQRDSWEKVVRKLQARQMPPVGRPRPDDADYEAASTVAFRLKADLQLGVVSSGRWQAGVATFPADGVDAESLIHATSRRLGQDVRAA